MTGQLVYPGTGEKSRVSFLFSDGTSLDFNDNRVFGELRLVDDWKELPFIRKLGPEPFSLSPRRFKELCSAKRTSIKPLLMDQAFLSGIGNLYAAEALFRSRIHPQRSASSLSDREKETLLSAITAILREAISCGGSSVDDFVRLSGKPGSYVRFHKVYGRLGKPCMICKTAIVRIALGGRGTYFCPNCQRMR
jgi:formamidopyrimidine-DNA glycosylase